VPPQIEAESKSRGGAKREQARRRTPTATLANDGGQNSGTPQAPRVQPLSPTELWKLQLRASDPSLTVEQKKAITERPAAEDRRNSGERTDQRNSRAAESIARNRSGREARNGKGGGIGAAAGAE